MRIVIDLQGAQTESRFRGIGRYSLSLSKAIVRNCGKHEVIIVLSDLFPDTIESIRFEFIDLLPQENIRVWSAPGSVCESDTGNSCRQKVAELIREAFLASLQPDLIYITSLFEGYVDDAVTSVGRFDQITPIVATLYDLIPLLNSEHYLKPNPVYKEYYLKKIKYLKKSSLLLAISDHVVQEGLDNLEQFESPIVNISTAVSSDFRPLTMSPLEVQSLFEKFGITRPFLFYTGGSDERKNLPRLIHAYAKLTVELRGEHQLIFAGKMAEDHILLLQQEAETAGLNSSELIFTGYIADDELVKLYNLCKLYVFPSWHEGFGLPTLEAMSCGAAVIGANTTSVPEVIGREYAMFDPFDASDIAKKMTKVLTNDSFRKQLIDEGLQQASKFSWDECAIRAIDMFERTHKEFIDSHQLEPEMNTDDLIDSITDIENGEFTDHEQLAIADSIAKNHPVDLKRRLFVDISELAQRDAKTGVQRVVRNILKELIEHPPENYFVEAVYASTETFGYRHAKKFRACFLGLPDQDIDDELIEAHPGDIFLGLDLQHHVVHHQIMTYNYFKRIGVRVYFVVYDLLPILLPNAFPEEAAINHVKWLDVVTQADGAICISHAVADELAVWVKEHGSKRLRQFSIDWFHLGADIEHSVALCGMPDDGESVLTILADRTSFLMVGTIEPRKGNAQVLAAFERLWADGIDVNLVMVGKAGWMVEALLEKIRAHPELGLRLFWLDGISDEYLEKIYAAATCLIAASEGEGFGLPLIEAAQHGVPMIVRDIPVFREVAGEHAYFFQTADSNTLAQDIQTWLVLLDKKQMPLSGSMYCQTWKKSAEQIKNIIIKEKL